MNRLSRHPEQLAAWAGDTGGSINMGMFAAIISAKAERRFEALNLSANDRALLHLRGPSGVAGSNPRG